MGILEIIVLIAVLVLIVAAVWSLLTWPHDRLHQSGSGPKA